MITMDLCLKQGVVTALDSVVDVGPLVIAPIEECEVFFGVDRSVSQGEDGARIQRRRIDMVRPIHLNDHHWVATHDGLDVPGVPY